MVCRLNGAMPLSEPMLILLIGRLGTNFSEKSIKILTFSFGKMRLKVSSAKWRPFCLGLNELSYKWPLSCHHIPFPLWRQLKVTALADNLSLEAALQISWIWLRKGPNDEKKLSSVEAIKSSCLSRLSVILSSSSNITDLIGEGAKRNDILPDAIIYMLCWNRKWNSAMCGLPATNKYHSNIFMLRVWQNLTDPSQVRNSHVWHSCVARALLRWMKNVGGYGCYWRVQCSPHKQCSMCIVSYAFLRVTLSFSIIFIWFKHIYFITTGKQLYDYTSHHPCYHRPLRNLLCTQGGVGGAPWPSHFRWKLHPSSQAWSLLSTPFAEKRQLPTVETAITIICSCNIWS